MFDFQYKTNLGERVATSRWLSADIRAGGNLAEGYLKSMPTILVGKPIIRFDQAKYVFNATDSTYTITGTFSRLQDWDNVTASLQIGDQLLEIEITNDYSWTIDVPATFLTDNLSNILIALIYGMNPFTSQFVTNKSIATYTFPEEDPNVFSCDGAISESAFIIADATSTYSLEMDGTTALTNVSIDDIVVFINQLGLNAQLLQECSPTDTDLPTPTLGSGSNYTVSYRINDGAVESVDGFTSSETRAADLLNSLNISYNFINVFGNIYSGENVGYFGVHNYHSNNHIVGFSAETVSNPLDFVKDSMTITFVATDNLQSEFFDGAQAVGLIGVSFHTCGNYVIPGV